MRKLRAFFIASIVLLAASLIYCSGCSPSEPALPVQEDMEFAPDQPMDEQASATPLLPSTLVSLDNVCDQMNRPVVLTGSLHLPDPLPCTEWNDQATCYAQLQDPYTDCSITIELPIDAASRWRPAPRRMAGLPAPYEPSDFRVGSDYGQLLGEGDLVRLSGTISPAFEESLDERQANCTLTQIQAVEAIPALPSVDGFERSTLTAAIERGQLRADIRGDSLSQIDLVLTSLINTPQLIEIEPGTVFTARNGDVQNMVARARSFVVLRPQGSTLVQLEAACLNMGKDEPRDQDSFEIHPQPPMPELHKLMGMHDLRFEPFRIQQYAIWTLTDNPSPDGFAAVGRTGKESGPTAEEIGVIRQLFYQAEIDPAVYQALQ